MRKLRKNALYWFAGVNIVQFLEMNGTLARVQLCEFNGDLQGSPFLVSVDKIEMSVLGN